MLIGAFFCSFPEIFNGLDKKIRLTFLFSLLGKDLTFLLLEDQIKLKVMKYMVIYILVFAKNSRSFSLMPYYLCDKIKFVFTGLNCNKFHNQKRNKEAINN